MSAPALAEDDPARRDLKDLTFAELEHELERMGEARYRARQIWTFVYKHLGTRFEDLHTLSKDLRRRLDARFHLDVPPVVDERAAADGTRKWVLGLGDGRAVEAVLIPDGRRLTLCISSQAGCAYACGFCLTGARGFGRNLTSGEILGQVLQALRATGGAERAITNLVFMGQGEPLANERAVHGAIEALTASDGVAFSGRRITVSTVGLVPAMRRLIDATNVELAISLHATTDAVRDLLIPVNRRHPIGELLATCRALEVRKRCRITFEYTMLRGVNDGAEDARRLPGLLRGIPAKVNLIPFNTFPGARYESTPLADIEAFAERLRARGVHATIRRTRGADVSGACGMLGTVRVESGAA